MPRAARARSNRDPVAPGRWRRTRAGRGSNRGWGRPQLLECCTCVLLVSLAGGLSACTPAVLPASAALGMVWVLGHGSGRRRRRIERRPSLTRVHLGGAGLAACATTASILAKTSLVEGWGVFPGCPTRSLRRLSLSAFKIIFGLDIAFEISRQILRELVHDT